MNSITFTSGSPVTLADHAEQWWEEQGNQVADRDSTEWMKMYYRWFNFAWKDIPGSYQVDKDGNILDE